MDRKIPVVSMLMFVLLGLLVMSINVKTSEAWSGGTIYIRSDGSVDPVAAPVQRNGDLYTFTDNINSSADGIVIERNNVVLDGAGHIFQGGGNGTGMTLSSRANVTATNMTIEGFHCGIIVNSSLYGYDPHNINIIGNNITGNYIGIKMQDGWSSNLSRNSIRKNWTGIWISNYMYNQIRGNDLTENSYGIFLGSDYNTISFNNITASNLYGIQIMGDYNDVDSNNITNNYWGLDLTCSDYCSITGNNIAYNNMYPHAGYARGIRLIGCSDTWIYCNNFTNNTAHVQSNSLLSVWDYRKRGNYWSDYKARYPNAIANLTSGTWDTPYIIDVNNTDHYPLVNPVPNIPEFSSILLVPLFMSTTLIAIALCRRKRETDC